MPKLGLEWFACLTPNKPYLVKKFVVFRELFVRRIGDFVTAL